MYTSLASGIIGEDYAGIVYLLLTHGTHIHKARCSALDYLVTQNLFTPLLEWEKSYVALVHSLSHQVMTQASDQLHTTSFSPPPVSGNTGNTCNTRDTWSHLLLVHM